MKTIMCSNCGHPREDHDLSLFGVGSADRCRIYIGEKHCPCTKFYPEIHETSGGIVPNIIVKGSVDRMKTYEIPGKPQHNIPELMEERARNNSIVTHQKKTDELLTELIETEKESLKRMKKIETYLEGLYRDRGLQ